MDINEFCNNISYASVHEEGKPRGGMNRHLHNHDRSLRWDRHDETSVCSYEPHMAALTTV